MPNVPNVPGVPALSSYSLAPTVILAADVVSLIDRFFGPHWGLFLDGEPAVVADNVVSFDYRQDWDLLTYQVEEGGFQTYNKVEHPFDTRLRFSAGGSEINRQLLLDSALASAASLDLFDAVTPERVYTDVNVTHVDFRRTARNGVGLITIDVWLVEVRVSATTSFTNTQLPQNQGQQAVGNVQAQAPTPALAGAVGGGFF